MELNPIRGRKSDETVVQQSHKRRCFHFNVANYYCLLDYISSAVRKKKKKRRWWWWYLKWSSWIFKSRIIKTRFECTRPASHLEAKGIRVHVGNVSSLGNELSQHFGSHGRGALSLFGELSSPLTNTCSHRIPFPAGGRMQKNKHSTRILNSCSFPSFAPHSVVPRPLQSLFVYNPNFGASKQVSKQTNTL